MKLTSSYYSGEGPAAGSSGRPSPDAGLVRPGFAEDQWPWDSDLSRCNDFDLQPAPKPHTPSECAGDLDIFLDYEFDRRVDRAAAIGVGGRRTSKEGGIDAHAMGRPAQKANRNGSWPFPRRRTARNRVRKGMAFGTSVLEPASLAVGSIGVNGQQVYPSDAADIDAIDPSRSGSSGSAATELVDEALAYLENALGNGKLSDCTKKTSCGQLMRGSAAGAGAHKGRRASNLNMAELAGSLTSSLATTKMPPFPRHHSRRKQKEADSRQKGQERESDTSASEFPLETGLPYRSSGNSSFPGVSKQLSERLKNSHDLCINGSASASKSHKAGREGKEPPMASPDAVDSFLNTFMTSIGHNQSSSSLQPPASDPGHEASPAALLSLVPLPRSEFRSRPSCFRVQKADMPLLNVMGVRKERTDNLQHLGDDPPPHHRENYPAEWPEPGPAAHLLGLSLDSATEGTAAGGDKGHGRGQDEASAVARVKSGRRRSLSAPKARTVPGAEVEERKDPREEESALDKSWRWMAEDSRGSSAVSGTEIWDFRTHLETPSTAKKPYRNDDPWFSPASRQQPRVRM